MAPSKAQGVDALGPRDVLRLPGVGRRQLVGLINSVEQKGAWPDATSTALGAAAPKDAGGCRVLGLLSLPFKVWGRLRAGPSTAWSEKLGAFWGAAIADSSALRAALTRAPMDERAELMDIDHAT
eukprot:3254926-Pyramimonas_sp.AAC.1